MWGRSSIAAVQPNPSGDAGNPQAAREFPPDAIMPGAMTAGQPGLTANGLPVLVSAWQPHEVELLKRAVVDAKLQRYASLTSQPPAVVAAALGNNEGRIMELDVRVDWESIAEKYLPARGAAACRDFWNTRFEHFRRPQGLPPDDPRHSVEVAYRRDLREMPPRTPEELKAEFLRGRDAADYADPRLVQPRYRHHGGPSPPLSAPVRHPIDPTPAPQAYAFRSDVRLDRKAHSAISDRQYGASTANIIENLRYRAEKDGPMVSDDNLGLKTQIDTLKQRIGEMEDNHRREMEVQRTMIDNLEREFWKIKKQVSEMTGPPISPTPMQSTKPQGPGTALRRHVAAHEIGTVPPR